MKGSESICPLPQLSHSLPGFAQHSICSPDLLGETSLRSPTPTYLSTIPVDFFFVSRTLLLHKYIPESSLLSPFSPYCHLFYLPNV